MRTRPMASQKDKLLSSVLIDYKLIKGEHVQECMQILDKVEKTGRSANLSSILVSKGYASNQKMSEIFEKMSLHIFTCPSCSEIYFLPKENTPGNTITCEKCQGVIHISSHQKVQTMGMFAHYRIEKELGRGGMGAVYQVYDTKLERTVALKVVLSEGNLHPIQIKRFLREAKATAQLRHPNIVEVYEVGSEPQNYFTMEHIVGGTLSNAIREKKLKLSLFVKIIQKCCDALHLAHENGIIHRDIKPSNIMLTKENEPKIMDFGLVKITDSDEKLSQTGGMMGTPAYMPPEQADGNVDHRADVYSLGATLYEVLTGRGPFQGETYLNILRQVYGEEPVSPSLLNPDIPKELEAICLKCLEKKPEKRYSSARSLSKELQNYLDNKPIKAKPPTTSTKIKKWLIRNRNISLVIAIALMVFSLSLTLFILGIQHERNVAVEAQRVAEIEREKVKEEKKNVEREKQKVEDERQITLIAIEEKEKALRKEEQARKEASDSAYYANIILANKYADENKTLDALNLLEHLEKHQNDLRDWEWNWIQRRIHYEDKSWLLRGHPDECKMKPESNIVAVCMMNEVILFDLVKEKIVQVFKGHSQKVTSCDFNLNGTLLATGGADGKIILWNVQTGQAEKILTFEKAVTSCLFSPDGKSILSTYEARDNETLIPNQESILVWDIKTGKTIKKLKTVNNQTWNSNIFSCVFSPDGKFFATTGDNALIALWDAQTYQLVHILKAHREKVESCSFSPDGKYLLSGSYDRTIRLWDYKRGKLLRTYVGHSDKVKTVVFSPDSETFASGGYDHNVYLWNIKKPQPTSILGGHVGKINRCVYTSRGEQLVSVSATGRLKLWNIKAKERKHPSLFHKEGSVLYSCGISSDGKILAASPRVYFGVRVWSFPEGKDFIEKTPKTIPFAGHLSSVNQMDFNLVNSILATAGNDRTLGIWSLKTGKILHKWSEHTGQILTCTFSPDGQLLASAGKDNQVIIREVQTGKIIKKYQHRADVNTCAFHPNSKILAASGEDSRIYLYNLEADKVQGVLQGNKYPVNQIEFSPDGKKLISASEGTLDSLLLWDVQKQEIITRFIGHTRNLLCCSFSPNGRRVATGSMDDKIKIWDATNNTPREEKTAILTLDGHLDRVTSCIFSPDGYKIISTSYDQTIRVWDASPFNEELMQEN